MAEKRIALFGGTFDPIHLGHTLVAAEALKKIAVEKVVFIPAKRSPLKGFFPQASDHDRLEMAALAIADNQKFELSDYELKRHAPSYTLETINRFKDYYGPATVIHWLVGADSVDELPYWHKIMELIDACKISTMYRAGYEKPDFDKFEPILGRKRVKKLQRNIIATSLIDISSTEIRKRLAKGLGVTNMLHPAVIDYIRNRGLYGSKLNS
jgi:nicotinate-nucleotide adenylyltransferase